MRHVIFAATVCVAPVLTAGCGGSTPGRSFPDGTTAQESSFPETTPDDAMDRTMVEEHLEDAREIEVLNPSDEATLDTDPAKADERAPAVICDPGAIENRFGARIRCTEDGSSWVDAPCPGGTVFDGQECIPNQTIVVLVADAYLDMLTFYADDLPTDLFCKVAEWAKQAEAPWWFVPDEAIANVCDPITSFYQSGYKQLLPYFMAYYIRRIVESLRDIPNLRIVLVHPPVRTRHPDMDAETYDERGLSAWGYYQPVRTSQEKPCPLETYDGCLLSQWQDCDVFPCECERPWFSPYNLLDAVLPFSVVGYPEPLAVGMDDLLRWVDLQEEVADTAKPCATDFECGTGTCHEGSCWEHVNPEIRATKKDHEIFGYDGPSSPMLFLAVQLLRMIEKEGYPCTSSEDCKPFGGCVNKRCHDPGFACRRRHIVHITHTHGPLFHRAWVPEVLAARWLRTGLACKTSDGCAAGVECGPIQGKDRCFVDGGFQVPPQVCAPPANPFPEVPTAGLIEMRLAGLMESIPHEPAPTARDVGPPIRGQVHVVLSPPTGIPGGRGGWNGAWSYLAAVSVGGGGHLVLPEPAGGPTWVKWAFGGFVEGGWEKHLNDMIDEIRMDATGHECTKEDLQGFPEEWLDTAY